MRFCFMPILKSLKGYKAIVGILSKTKHRTFSQSAEGPVIFVIRYSVMLICRVRSYP